MAIQVNGTQVIGNSRELTNIASVDATTATAIGNAGVGGAHTLIQSETSFTSAVNPEFDISTGNYSVYYIDLIELEHNNSSAARPLVFRLFDSSNNRIDTATYQNVGERNSSFEVTDNQGFFGHPSFEDWYNSSYNGKAYVSIEVRNSNSSTIPTLISYRTTFTTGADGSISPRTMTFGTGFLKSNQATPKFALACHHFTSGSTITGKYRSWGLK